MSATLQEGQVILPNVRIGYPKIWKAEAIKSMADSRPRFGLQAYLPKADTATKANLDAEITRLSKEKLKGVKPKSRDLFIKDGDGEDGDESTAGHWIVSVNRQESQNRPQIIDRNRAPLAQEDGRIYAGCRCNVLMAAYVPKGWAKIAASLEVVQFWADDEPFGAPRVDVDAVMPCEDDEFSV